MKLQPLKNLIKPIIVSLVIAVAFISYMVFIGVPKTQAAGYYTLAKEQEGLKDRAKAEEYFRKAIDSFPEVYIQKEYQQFKNAAN